MTKVARAGRRLSAVALLVPGTLVLTGAAAPVAAPASSAARYCTDADGVTVVVDLQELGGGVVVRCAAGAGAGQSGLDALTAAGFSYDMPSRSPGLVCRIAGRPSGTEQIPVDGDDGYVERCDNVPPTAAYWSYWYATDGGRWTYSSAGPANRDTIAGGFEGWSFSLNHSQSAAPPPRLAARNPHAPYDDGASGQPGGSGGSGGGGGGTGTGTGTGTGGSGGDGGSGGPSAGGGGGDGGGGGTEPGTSGDPATNGPATGDPPVSGPDDGASAGPEGGQVGDGSGGGPGQDGGGGASAQSAGAGSAAGNDDGTGQSRTGPDKDRASTGAPGAEPDAPGPDTDLVVTGDVPTEPRAEAAAPPASTLLGAAVLAGLGLVGAALAWRRRSRGASGS